MTTAPTKNESLPELHKLPEYWRQQMREAGMYPQLPCTYADELEAVLTREAPTEGVPDGWKLVPVEPTEAMCGAIEYGAARPIFETHRGDREYFLRKAIAAAPTPPAPQRLAQVDCPRARIVGWWNCHCEACEKHRAENTIATQPPHHDRGEVSERAKQILGDEYKRTHDANPRVNLDEATYGLALRAVTAALTEAKQQGPGEAVIVGYDPGQDDREAEDYHVIMAMGRLLAAIAISVKGPEPAGTAWSYHDLPDIVAALQEAAEQVADEMTAWAATKMADRGSSRRDRLMISEWAKRLRNPEIFPVKDFEVEGTTLTKEEMRAIVRKVIASSPQVEAKRQTGEGESPSLKRIIPAAHPYPKPDQVTGADTGSIGEHAYADGWNDCRKAMIAAAAKPSGEDKTDA